MKNELKEIENILAEVDAAKEAAMAPIKSILVKAIKDAFKKVPEADTIHWCQYTPYWNDGEQCFFFVHGLCFTNSKDLEPGETLDLAQGNVWHGKKSLGIFDLFETIPHEYFKDLFGDHVAISVKRESPNDFIVEEFDEHQ